jgi:hypothetical protein
MDPARPKSARPVTIADHLWELFEEMAQSMGSDRDALINQAMFMFAKVNGFLEPSRGSAAAGLKTNPADHRPPFEGASEFEAASPPPFELLAALPAPDGDAISSAPEREVISPLPEHEPPSVPAEPAQGWGERQAVPPQEPKTDDDSGHRRVAERILQTAAELERMIQDRSEPRIQLPGTDGYPQVENGAALHRAEGAGLFVVSEDGHQGRVTKDRFLIGRGKHCDFVISSGKVSREHAVIVREGSDYFIEDLGSSNGTWFNKQRVKRRKIADGDEYFICSDKIRLLVR